MRSSGLGTISLPLRFTGDAPVEAPLESGVWGHGWLFHLFATAAPQAGDAFHAGGADRRPFSLTPLLNAPDGPLTPVLMPGAVAWLRIGYLDQTVLNLWEQALRPALLRDPAVQLGPLRFSLAGPPTIEARSWESLIPVAAPRAWWVSFRSPAVFKLLRVQTEHGRTPERYLALPDPALMLTSLAKLWTRFAPSALQDLASGERIADLIAHVQLDAARVETEPLPRKLGVPLGFTGDVVLFCLNGRDGAQADRARRQLLGALMGMARVSGIGSKTARGLGMLDTAAAEAAAPSPGDP